MFNTGIDNSFTTPKKENNHFKFTESQSCHYLQIGHLKTCTLHSNTHSADHKPECQYFIGFLVFRKKKENPANFSSLYLDWEFQIIIELQNHRMA